MLRSFVHAVAMIIIAFSSSIEPALSHSGFTKDPWNQVSGSGKLNIS